ncbi:lysophospholipid acyltransferase family protein [Solimonas variicoloris]|uniref:lysophospholipid acyltransferase family protein n=1 Tax=Solimonas variicoloris TaxID=254408 RepID=UPI00036A8757|nr:lysophospholipid acyltransferase family protein [Solimonas variicoloris]
MKSWLRFLIRASGAAPLWLLHGLGAAVGALLWRVPNKQRRLTLWHLDHCLPELGAGERERIARASLGHMFKAVLEAPALWFGRRRRLERWLDDPAAARQVEALRAQGRGVIWLCPHIGAWELAGLFCSAHGPMTSLYKPQKGTVDAIMYDGRTRLGARLVPTTGAGVKALLAALRNQEMIGILPDHDPPRGAGVYAPLFGMTAHTTELVTKLAARSGAPVWFCIAERLPRGRGYRFHLSPAPADIADPQTGVAALNRGVEAVIRALPEQYWWAYERYRHQPDGQPNPYRLAATSES